MSSRLVVMTRNKTALVLSTLIALSAVSLGQTNPQNVPQPPSVELQKFEPFLGNYEVSGDYANLPWAGSLELKKVIKGWYIEQIIRIKSPGIDREFWVLATWDKNAQKYRLWGFQTLPSQIEGNVRFEDDEMITEFTYPAADGQKATSTNHYKFVGNNELLVTSYRQVGNGPVEKIGTLMGKRITGLDASSKQDNEFSAAEAQTNPFVGTWQFVPERSHFDGTAPKDIKLQFLIDKGELREKEEITRSNGTTLTTIFIPQYDHLEHPLTISGETKHKTHAVLWTRVDDRTIERRINHDNGLEYTTERLAVSSDGQALTETHLGKHPDGTPYETVIAFQLNGASTTAAARAPDVKSSDLPAEAELRAFMAELQTASIEGDVETAANSMTDDYIQTDVNGYRQDKTTWLNEYFRPLADLIRAGKFHWDEFERKNLEFRLYGDCAVVTGELQAKGTGARFGPQHTLVADPNASFSGTLHFTHVYIKRNGKWLLAGLHNQMPLPPANVVK